MATIASIEDLEFAQEDLDYESNGGIPIIISSINSLQVLDSYLKTTNGEKKLYRPNPQNNPITWELSLFIKRDKINKINSLVEKQMMITREFRLSFDTTLLSGFKFSINNSNFSVDSARVWLASFSINVSAYSTDNELRSKCKLSVTEIE